MNERVKKETGRAGWKERSENKNEGTEGKTRKRREWSC